MIFIQPEPLIRLVRKLPMNPAKQEALLFFLKMGYWPNLKQPKTFNEKINWLKLFSNDPLITLCSDKIAVRGYVEKLIGSQYLIPMLYAGNQITAEQLHALGDDIVAKPNHDSKSTEIIRENTPQIASLAATRLQAKLDFNFGQNTNQFPYATIKPGILVEKLLVEKGKQCPDDYKIFCFKQADGSIKMFVKVHENRGCPNYQNSFYDEHLNPIKLRNSKESKPFTCPDIWPEMKALATELAQDFQHVRVDFYQIDGQIFFGELTFFSSGGRIEYSRDGEQRHQLDREMGDCWTLKEGGSVVY